MSDWTIFGERLSHIMREYDISLRELSRRTGITLTTLHRYATCKRVPKATEIMKCADALGITCDYLLGLSDDPHLSGKGERIISKACDKPKREQGRWEPEFNGMFTGGAYWFKCSECNRIVPDVRNGGWNFCPQCGSDMRGEQE